jgi:hypothetical protein
MRVTTRVLELRSLEPFVRRHSGESCDEDANTLRYLYQGCSAHSYRDRLYGGSTLLPSLKRPLAIGRISLTLGVH